MDTRPIQPRMALVMDLVLAIRPALGMGIALDSK